VTDEILPGLEHMKSLLILVNFSELVIDLSIIVSYLKKAKEGVDIYIY